MNKTAFTLLTAAALLSACQPTPKQTVITGMLTDMGSDTVVVSYCPVSDLNRRDTQEDTIVLQQGRFTLTFANDSTPTAAYLYSLNLTSSAAIKVVAFPGETVQVTGSVTDHTLQGNEFHAAWRVVMAQCKPYIVQMRSIADLLTTKQKAGASPDSIRAIYQNDYRPALEKMVEMQKDYILQHPDEDISVYLLSDLGSKYAEELLPLIGEKAKSGSMASLYRAMEKSVQEKNVRKEAKQRIVERAAAPDFTLKDIHGNDLSLSSLRGKHVVLDFWGSWCGWCIKGIPDMKKYYGKYKDKMEILGIDCRDTEEEWKAAVKEHDLPWLHVRNDGEPDVTAMYGIQGYPTKIMVDPEGNINKVVVGEDPAFYTYLDELFK